MIPTTQHRVPHAGENKESAWSNQPASRLTTRCTHTHTEVVRLLCRVTTHVCTTEQALRSASRAVHSHESMNGVLLTSHHPSPHPWLYAHKTTIYIATVHVMGGASCEVTSDLSCAHSTWRESQVRQERVSLEGQVSQWRCFSSDASVTGQHSL